MFGLIHASKHLQYVAMLNKFEFSLRRVFGAVALFGFGLSLFAWLYGRHSPGAVFWPLLFASGAALGGAAGLILRRPFRYAIGGGVLMVLAVFAYLVWWASHFL